MLQGIIQFFANIRGLVTLASKKNIEKDLKVLRKKEVKQLSEHFARITLYHSHSWKWQACIYIQKESFFAFKYIEYGNNALKKPENMHELYQASLVAIFSQESLPPGVKCTWLKYVPGGGSGGGVAHAGKQGVGGDEARGRAARSG